MQNHAPTNLRVAAWGRFLPVAILSPDRQLLGGSSHWGASSKSQIHDICERQQRVKSEHSLSATLWLGTRWSLDHEPSWVDGRPEGRNNGAG